ncbi:MAG: AraC family transcriptional regulator [Pseudomonadota bacterium]|nr:AraC family transcriptional regulator [Pseudomonadota bacterium]
MGNRPTKVSEAGGQHAEARRQRIRNSEPAAYLRTMLGIAAERGISADDVLKGSRLTLAMLETPDFRVTAPERAAVMMRVIQLTGDRGLGLEFGLRTTPTAHGYVGYAAMSCPTLGDALDLVVRYLHLRQRDVMLRLSVKGESAILESRDTHQLGPLRHIIHECILIGMVRMFGFLVGEERPPCELWFDWPEPDYYAPYAARLPPVKFNASSVQLRLPAEYLQRRLVMADSIAVKRAVEQCEREMATVSPPAENLLERVRAELTPRSDGYPDLESVAACLFMSGRTLKRKLEARGSNFQQLLDEVRHRDALRLLDNPDLDIQHIATALGYRDPPSFTRAFRRWSGKTPSQARSGG